MMMMIGGGTITVPHSPPSPKRDSEHLWKAFKGWGTDEKAIIGILGHRDAQQRREIARTYHQLYHESLSDRLHSELSGPLSGDFRRAVILWAMDPAERDARLAKEALDREKKSISNGDGGGCRHLWVIVAEIACASSPDHLTAVRQAYCSLFHSSLEEDVASRFSQLPQPLAKMLVGLVTSYRYGGELVDEELAKTEATQLHDVIIGKKQLFHEDVNRILSTRSKSQLKATFNHYKRQCGNAIDEDIMSHSSNDKFANLLKVAVWCINSPEKHFAEVVRSSVVGLGTDEDSLTRAVVARAEIDMQKIKEEYKNIYKVALDDDVIGDTSGCYKDFLLTLLGSK